MFQINLDTANTAFDGEEGPIEVARILEKVVQSLEDGKREGSLFDVNGNRVGSWSFEHEY